MTPSSSSSRNWLTGEPPLSAGGSHLTLNEFGWIRPLCAGLNGGPGRSGRVV